MEAIEILNKEPKTLEEILGEVSYLNTHTLIAYIFFPLPSFHLSLFVDSSFISGKTFVPGREGSISNQTRKDTKS
jgi:hypothetical protein